MKKTQGLKTLGDYRRAAKDSLFDIYLPSESKSTSAYDAIKTALYHYRNIIHFSRSSFSERDWWGGIYYPGTKYEMINPTLFDCIKLMEFEKKYHEKSIYELYPAWPKRAEPNAKFFTFIGYSYLEVGFNLVRKQGSDIIAILQNAYLDYNKEIKIRHIPSIIFLNKTPRVDELKINPKPDIIIKTWFDNMLKGMKSGCPKSEYPRHIVKTEFNSIEKQLEHEWNTWKKTSDGDMAGYRKRGTPETTEPKVEPIRDQVFICYSHKDKRWLNELQTHLKPYVRNGSITAWSDEQIPPGTEWFEQIKRVLASTKVAVLLITKDFLASEFIHEHELRPLLKEAEKGDVHIIWIPVSACSYKETPLKDYQAAIDPEKPLAKIKKADRDEAWVRICEEINKAVGR